MKNLHKFSERLGELMFYDNNITSDNLGEKLGLGGSSIRIWRTGKSIPSLSKAITLANYFNCSLDFLLGRIDDDIKYSPKPLPIFHEHLVSIINKRGISWYKVVKDTKVSKTSLQGWREGSDPSIVILNELANYLDVSIDYLIGRES